METLCTVKRKTDCSRTEGELVGIHIEYAYYTIRILTVTSDSIISYAIYYKSDCFNKAITHQVF